MPLSLPRTIRRSCVAAVAATLFAVLALLGPGGAAPANAATYCGFDVSVTIHSDNPYRDLVVALPKPYDANGTQPIMWSHLSNQNQRWCPVPIGTTQFEYRNALSGKCLTAAGPPVNGTPVNQQACGGSTYQRWTVNKATAGSALKNVGTGGCLDVIEKNANAGAKLQIWGCNYSAWNQTWWFGRYGD